MFWIRRFKKILFEVDKRPLRLNGGLSNKTRTPENPQGLHRDWIGEKEGVVYAHLSQDRIYRTILRQPAGNKPGNWVSFSNWHTLTPIQQEIMKTDIRKWKSEGLYWNTNKAGVFFRYKAENPFRLHIRKQIPLDPRNPTALIWFYQNAMPYIDAGMEEIWLDGGGAEDTRKQLKRFIPFAKRNWGIKIGVEALPLIRSSRTKAKLDFKFMRYAPSMTTWSFFQNWVLRLGNDWRIPFEFESHILLHKSRHPLQPDPTLEDIDMLKERGFIISWLIPKFI